MTVLIYLGLCLLPALVFQLCARGLERWSRGPTRPSTRSTRRSAARDEKAALDRYRRDLRRLSADHDRLLTADLPARATRIRAVRMAYDDTLRRACSDLELEAPPERMDDATRVLVEADLVLHGLTW